MEKSMLSTAIEEIQRQIVQKRAETLALEQALEVLKGRSLSGHIVPTSPNPMEYQGLGIADASKRFIQEVGRPVTTRELADVLLARGFVTKSAKFTNSVYATLVGSKQFVRTNDRWWLKDLERSHA
jgi:hypothetical protein